MNFGFIKSFQNFSGYTLPRELLLLYARNGLLDTIGDHDGDPQLARYGLFATGDYLTGDIEAGTTVVGEHGGDGEISLTENRLDYTATKKLYDFELDNGSIYKFATKLSDTSAVWLDVSGNDRHLYLANDTAVDADSHCVESIVEGSDWLNEMGWTEADGTQAIGNNVQLPVGTIIPSTISFDLSCAVAYAGMATFTIPAVTGAELDTLVTSAVVTPTGLIEDAVISIVGDGRIRLNETGNFSIEPQVISPSDTFEVQLVSSESNETSESCTVYINDASTAVFTVTTKSAAVILNIDPTFDPITASYTENGWDTRHPDWSITDGQAIHSGAATATGTLEQTLASEYLGKNVTIIIDVASNEGTGLNQVQIGGAYISSIHLGPGQYSFDGACTSDTLLKIFGRAGEEFILNSVTVIEG